MACPDLFILDLKLPKKSGHEILAKMRSTGTCSEVPVVVLSSSAALLDTKESKRLNVIRDIQKPLNLEDFMRIGAVLKALLSGTSSRNVFEQVRTPPHLPGRLLSSEGACLFESASG